MRSGPRSATTTSSTLLKEWIASQSGGNVTTAEFQALAEQVSGEDLDAFFQTWLFTPASRPGIDPRPAAKSKKVRTASGALDKAHVRR